MSKGLRKRVAQTEEDCQVGSGWRQFGGDPRDYPDWAPVAAVLWEREKPAQVRESAELVEVRRLYDACEIDAAFNLLTPILKARAVDRA